MDRTFTNLPTAESWLRWRGYTRYLGMWTWQTEDGTSTATMRDIDTNGPVTVVIHDEEI